MALFGDKVQIEHICRLLESPDTAHEIRTIILENLKTTKETWLTYALVDYYFHTPSQSVQEILAELRDFQAKALIDKLNDGMKSSEHRFSALQLILYLAYRELPWCHLLMDSPVFTSLLKFLKTDNDAVVVMTSLMVLVILLPSVPDSMCSHLPTIFEIFGRMATYCSKKPVSTAEAYIVHVHVALYSLFNRLYGMYPCLFLSFLNKFCTAKENIHTYEEIIMPMVERVRLHPRLITGLKETETSRSRWKDQETQDIVVDCSKFSLDFIEGSWEESPLPLLQKFQTSDTFAHKTNNPSDKGQSIKNVTKAIEDTISNSSKDAESISCMHLLSIDSSYVGESPSLLIGLSTPPSSQRTTPAASFVEHISNSGGPVDTPVLTPRLHTPSQGEDLEKIPYTMRHFPTSSDIKKPGNLQSHTTPGSNGLDSPYLLMTDNSSVCSTKTSAFGAPNQCTAVRSLLFNSPQEEKQETEKKDETVKNLTDSCQTKTASDLKSFTLPMESLPQIISSTLTTPDSDVLDQEVAEIIEKDYFEASSPSSSITTMTSQTEMTAESVRQFMKKVNRIRFNSLTSNSSSDYDTLSMSQGLLHFGHHRPRSCPPFKRQLFSTHSGGKGNGKKQVSAGESFVSKCYNRQVSLLEQPKPPREKISNTQHYKGSQKESSVIVHTSHIIQSDYKGDAMQSFMPFPVIFSPVIQYIFAPSKLSICNKCHKQLVVTSGQDSAEDTTLINYKGNEASLFSSMSPSELLERHIRLGNDIHNKESTTLITKDSTNWTHFGGNPPADEVNILKNQLLMLQNQLMYERHKRVNHDKRNRRLLRRIAGIAALEEQQKTLINNMRLHEETIQNLNVCVKLLEEDNRRLKQMQESDDYERLVQFRLALKENKDLKASSVALKDLLLTQKEDYDKQQKILEKVQHKNLENEKELEICRDRLIKAENLKEKVFQLQKEVLLMQELNQKCQEKLHLTKTSAGHKLEESNLIKSFSAELDDLRKENRKKNNLLEAYQTRCVELEAMLKNKENTLNDMKHGFEEAKNTHNEKLKAVEDRCKSMVNINQLLEAKCMELMAQLDKATHKKKIENKSLDSAAVANITKVISGKEQATLKLGGVDNPGTQDKIGVHTGDTKYDPHITLTKTSNIAHKSAAVVVANEKVSLAGSIFSDSDLTSTPHLLSSHTGQDSILDSGAASRSSYRGDSDVSINSFVTGDSGCWHKE